MGLRRMASKNRGGQAKKVSARHAAIVLLRDAAARVARGWCQHASAVDRHGKHLASWDRSATKHCALGALNAASFQAPHGGGVSVPSYGLARKVLHGALGPAGRRMTLQAWNDSPDRTKLEVVRLYARAIGRLSGARNGAR